LLQLRRAIQELQDQILLSLVPLVLLDQLATLGLILQLLVLLDLLALQVLQVIQAVLEQLVARVIWDQLVIRDTQAKPVPAALANREILALREVVDQQVMVSKDIPVQQVFKEILDTPVIPVILVSLALADKALKEILA
jgi:hypothetical protein